MTEDVNSAHPQAVQWIKDHTMREDVSSPTTTTSSTWPRHGCEPGWGVVWFTKLDLDPAADKELPGGWRDVEYVVWTDAFAFATAESMPQVYALYQNSVVVAEFGEGEDHVEIRQVTP